MAVEVVLPALGLTVEKGKILKWLKHEGDPVSKGEALYEVEADKVTTEVESPASGVLRKILIGEGVQVPILTVVGIVTDANEALPEKYKMAAAEKLAVPEPDRLPAQKSSLLLTSGPDEIRAVPAARRLARERGVDLLSIRGSGPGGTILVRDIESVERTQGQFAPRVLATPTAKKLAEREGVSLSLIQGTGTSGRIMKRDVMGAKYALNAQQETSQRVIAQESYRPAYQLGQIVPMSSMRKAIARRLTQSKFTAPHIYFFNEVEMEKLAALRDEVVGTFEQARGVRVSINDFFIKAVALALREYPLLNAKVLGEEIHIFAEINVGLAVAMEDGLIVPAISRADGLGLAEIALRRTDLVERARRGKLTLEEMERGTFTISSLAQFDIEFFTAILNPPQTGILTVGKMEERAVVRNGQIVARKTIKQGLSVDHRVVDGAVAASFLQSLKNKLENPYYTFLNN